ncbi:hypothetical protein BZZ01_20155 [Nostocales cyanobacterium HT-58-2]|nr:hypothetical protein BZZ01_20155 [Nostocales cyanobacterium HT-58-2]
MKQRSLEGVPPQAIAERVPRHKASGGTRSWIFATFLSGSGVVRAYLLRLFSVRITAVFYCCIKSHSYGRGFRPKIFGKQCLLMTEFQTPVSQKNQKQPDIKGHQPSSRVARKTSVEEQRQRFLSP